MTLNFTDERSLRLVRMCMQMSGRSAEGVVAEAMELLVVELRHNHDRNNCRIDELLSEVDAVLA